MRGTLTKRGSIWTARWSETTADGRRRGARLEVSQQLLATRGGLSFGPPKSRRSRRTIALDSETVTALREHREVQLAEREFAVDSYEDSDLVFADELGRPIHPDQLSKLFKRHRKAANADQRRPGPHRGGEAGGHADHDLEHLRPLAAAVRRDSRRARGSRAHGRGTR